MRRRKFLQLLAAVVVPWPTAPAVIPKRTIYARIIVEQKVMARCLITREALDNFQMKPPADYIYVPELNAYAGFESPS